MKYHCSCVLCCNYVIDVVCLDICVSDRERINNEIFSAVLNDLLKVNGDFCFIDSFSLRILDIKPFTKIELINDFSKIQKGMY